MMPKPTVYSGRPPSSPASPSVNSTSNMSARLIDSVRKMLAPRNSFQFTDYSPKRFAKIRKLSGISNEMYQRSFATTTMPDFSGGRSGAFVYFSSDHRYIVKTCTPYELETLLNLLPEYDAYLTREYRKKRNSLLTRYLGAHRIVMYDIPLYFLVMKNICFEKVDEKYDLKGSWISRHGSKKKKDPALSRPKKGSAEEQTVVPLFLDNDIQNAFLLKPEDAVQVASQLDRDTKFLQRKYFVCVYWVYHYVSTWLLQGPLLYYVSCGYYVGFNIMDYSLLVGVKRKLFVLNNNSHSPSFEGGVVSHLPPLCPDIHEVQAAAVEGPGIFYIGLIDLLQEWNWAKWFEHITKVYFARKDGRGISAVEPNYYRNRFMQRAVCDVFDGVERLPELPEEDDEVTSTVGSTSLKDERGSMQIEMNKGDQDEFSPIHEVA